MTEQRKVVIAQVNDQVWVSSSAAFINHKDNFRTAEGELEKMIAHDLIWSYEKIGDKTIAVKLMSDWGAIEDRFLGVFIPGICGVDSDIAIHDRGAEDPRRQFKMRTDPHHDCEFKPVLKEVTTVST